MAERKMLSEDDEGRGRGRGREVVLLCHHQFSRVCDYEVVLEKGAWLGSHPLTQRDLKLQCHAIRRQYRLLMVIA